MNKTKNQVNWIEEFKLFFRDYPLPGRGSQTELAAFSSVPSDPPAGVNEAGVMALLFPKGNEWHICFIERPGRNAKDPHRGQIAFPGGRKEKEDRDYWQTAIRETEEEVGVTANDIQPIGALTPLYIPVSNFVMYPYVGTIDYEPHFRRQPEEVDTVITAPITHFLPANAVIKKDMIVRGSLALQAVPHFQYKQYTIWGATAMVFNELRTIMRQLSHKID